MLDFQFLRFRPPNRKVAAPDIPGYQLLRQIGSGGMATVFLAVQMSLDRKVAIKVLRAAADDDPERTEKRFLREGRTLAKITHKNVCGIYDIAKVGDIAYIAMEYLDGGTLVDKLKKGLSVSESIAVVVQVASALEEAHKLGIIHRDLKPANVMLRGGRVPVLTDFGIARELTASHTRITAENMIVGTPIYMSPEQVSGGEVDGRSDLYALGIMFFELLTGQPPYKGDTPIAVCMQHLTAAIPALPPDLADLQPVINDMLAKRREDRYAGMADFTHALRDVFVGSAALRRVLQFSPDTPWSEQLRDLGFSFDTLRDADVKAALEAQRVKSKATGRKPVATRVGAVPGARPASRVWMAVLAVVIALGAAGGVGWWAWQKRHAEPDETTLLALSALQTEYFNRIEAGNLFAPKGGSALDTIRRMRGIDEDSSYTAQAVDALRKAATRRVRDALAASDLAQADAAIESLAKFQNELAPTELAALQQERATLAGALAGAQAVRERLERLQALLAGAAPAAGESVLKLYLDLQRTLAADADFQALVPRAEAVARAEIDTRLAAGDAAQAVKDARALAAVSKDRATTELLVRVESEAASAELARRLDGWKRLLAQPVDEAALATLNTQLQALTAAGLADADQQRLRTDLATAVVGSAQALSDQAQFEAALSLLGQARSALPSEPSLLSAQQSVTAARTQAMAAQKAAAEQASLGQLAISAAPWAKVIEIVNDAGQRIPLPANPVTPLVIALPEGRYRVTLADQQGGNRRQESTAVQRDQIANLTVLYNGYSPDDYLREVGW